MKKEPAKGFRLVFGYLGLFLAFEGIVTLFPLLTLIFYPGEWKVLLDFIVPEPAGIAIEAFNDAGSFSSLLVDLLANEPFTNASYSKGDRSDARDGDKKSEASKTGDILFIFVSDYQNENEQCDKYSAEAQ